MKNTKTLEFWVGIFILLGLGAFIFMALSVSGLSVAANPFVNKSYELSANFTDIGSLKVRAPVRISGVQIGTVVSISLDAETYEAHVVMDLNKNISISNDSSASITASGILGDNYVSISPGYGSTNFHNGDHFNTTYPATSWSSLISTFVNGAGSKK